MNQMADRLGTSDLLEQAISGKRRALGRLLTLIERGDFAADEVTELLHHYMQRRAGDDTLAVTFTGNAQRSAGNPDNAAVIGVTGAPGCGKSTLVGCLVTELAKESQAGSGPAVLAIDPSSPLTGGAILGDRIRMEETGPTARSSSTDRATDTKTKNTIVTAESGSTFIRSMATRGHAGGLALAVPAALRLFEACGYGPLVVETAGVGQVEVDVTRTADTTVVVVAPGMGDAVQANKSGLLEVADVLVVNKADRPGAEDTRRDLEHMLDLSHITGLAEQWRPPVVMTTAIAGDGADQVMNAVQAHRENLERVGLLEARREARIHHEVHDRVSQCLKAAADHYLRSKPDPLTAAIDGRITPAAAAAAISQHLLASDMPDI